MEVYTTLLGVAVIVLFERLARMEDENPRLWPILAGVAYYGLVLTAGVLWSLGAVMVLLGVFFARVFRRSRRARVR